MRRKEERSKQGQTNNKGKAIDIHVHVAYPKQSLFLRKMKGTKVQTLGVRAVAGVCMAGVCMVHGWLLGP